MAEIEQKTCVNFVPRKDQEAYLVIEPRNGLVDGCTEGTKVTLKGRYGGDLELGDVNFYISFKNKKEETLH